MMLEIGFLSVFLFCISLFSFFMAWQAYQNTKGIGFDLAGLFIVLFFVIVGLVCFYNSYNQALPETRDQSELEKKWRIEKIEKDKIPHVIREADGCKVYQFLGDNSKWYYFTRCENSSTVTSSPHTECQLVRKVNTCKDVFTNIETSTAKK